MTDGRSPVSCSPELDGNVTRDAVLRPTSRTFTFPIGRLRLDESDHTSSTFTLFCTVKHTCSPGVMSQVASPPLSPEHEHNPVDLELPSYHQVSQGRRHILRPSQVEHKFHLEKGGHKWLSLRLHSRAEYPDQQPAFLQGQVISGSVNLELRNAILIRSISISVSTLTDTSISSICRASPCGEVLCYLIFFTLTFNSGPLYLHTSRLSGNCPRNVIASSRLLDSYVSRILMKCYLTLRNPRLCTQAS